MFDRPFFVVCVSFVCLLVFFFLPSGEETEVLQAFWSLRAAAFQYPAFTGGTRPDFFEPMSRFVGRVLAPKGRPPCRTVPRPFESGGDPSRTLLCLFLLVGVCFVVSGYHTETQRQVSIIKGTPYGLPPC